MFSQILPIWVFFWALCDVQAVDPSIFNRSVTGRLWQSAAYALSKAEVDVSTFASAIANTTPTYVSGILRLSPNFQMNQTIIDDYNTVRDVILAKSPNAKFDVELNLDPNATAQTQTPYTSGSNVVSHLKYINSVIDVDGFFFDFYSNAQKFAPDWVVDVITYAHSQNQFVGGNVFGGVAPPNSDFVSFVNPDNSSNGYALDVQQINNLHQNASGLPLIGHFNNNAQNGNGTFSCQWINDYTPAQQADYMQYFASQQRPLAFTFLYPIFFPQCPGVQDWNPLDDYLSNGTSLYKYTLSLIDEYQ